MKDLLSLLNLLNLTVVWVLSHWEIGPISVH